MPRKDAIRAVATRAGVPKRVVYDAVHGVGRKRERRADPVQVGRERAGAAARPRAAAGCPSRCRTRSSTTTATSTSPTATGWQTGEAIAPAGAVGVTPDRADRLRPARARAGRSSRRRSTPRWWPASRCTPTRRPVWQRRDGSTRRWPRSSALAADARPGPGRRRDRAGLLPHRGGGSRRAGRVVRPAHRAGQAARQDAGDPRPRRPRRRSWTCIDAEGRARALGDALLLRRRRASPAPAWTGAPTSPSPARSPSRTPSRCATRCGHAAGPGAGRDRRAVPDAVALPRAPQRVVPRAGDGARDGGDTRRRPGASSAGPSTPTPRRPSVGPGSDDPHTVGTR